jgi:DNA-binding response OmpR family regulator
MLPRRTVRLRLIALYGARTATREGRHLDLSVKEFGVLEALLRASPAFVSAEQLLEQVWDEFADPFTNTVTVTVGRPRRKLGDPPVITTTPGVGDRIAGGVSGGTSGRATGGPPGCDAA